MEKIKTTKKILKNLINESIQAALAKLELPEPSKKAKKLISKNSKKLATIFADAAKREQKKKLKIAKSNNATAKKKSKKKVVVAG